MLRIACIDKHCMSKPLNKPLGGRGATAASRRSARPVQALGKFFPKKGLGWNGEERSGATRGWVKGAFGGGPGMESATHRDVGTVHPSKTVEVGDVHPWSDGKRTYRKHRSEVCVRERSWQGKRGGKAFRHVRLSQEPLTYRIGVLWEEKARASGQRWNRWNRWNILY
jgi:hypothetical protein